MQQFEIWLADLPDLPNSRVIHGYRPVIVVSKEKPEVSTLVTVVPLTTNLERIDSPTHVLIEGQGLAQTSVALCDQVLTVDRRLCSRCVSRLTSSFYRYAIIHGIARHLGFAA